MEIICRSESTNKIITSCESARFLWKNLSFHSGTWSWELMQQKPAGISQPAAYKPGLFDNSSLNKVPVARSSLQGSVSEGCRSSVFTQKWMWNVLPCQCDQLSPCRELRQAFRLSSSVFSLQSFSLFPQDWAAILQQCYCLWAPARLAGDFWYFNAYVFQRVSA